MFILTPIVYLRSQNIDRKLEKKEDLKPPIRITLIRSRIGVIDTDKAFSADEDWLKGLKVKLQNCGTEPVTYIELRLRIPRTNEQKEKGEVDLLFHLHYGTDPFVVSNGSVQAIAKDEEVELELSDDTYHVLRSSPRFPAKLNKIEISVSMLKFIDGTFWIAGEKTQAERA